MSATTTTSEPDVPAPERRRRMLRWLLIASVAAAVLVPFVRYEWGQNQERVMRNDLRASFTDLADARWACSAGDGNPGGTLFACDLRSGGELAPSVSFEAFDAPVDLEGTLAEQRREHLESMKQDHSGYRAQLTLLGTENWAPDAVGPVWGHVSRWRFDYDQPGAGYPVYSETLRYADKPFGVTASARSLDELAEVVASLTLPDPSELPD